MSEKNTITLSRECRASTFAHLLACFRHDATSERDKGSRFERLMQNYLLTEPHYACQLKNVWLWNEFPFHADLGGQDTGIDLVALTDSGAYWAVQCKCYAANTVINKAEVDTFLTTAGRSFVADNGETTKFEHCLWISTTNNWGANAEAAIRNHTPSVSRLSLHQLENSPVNWNKLADGLHGQRSRAPKHRPRPHQLAAIAAAKKHFTAVDRGQLIMACGTGKTFTALKIAEQHATVSGGTVLFLVPSIALLGQTLGEWLTHADRDLTPICVCSDPEVSKRKTKNADTDSFSVVDLALPASTSVSAIVKQLRAAPADRLTVIFSTYQSIDVVHQAQRAAGITFDLIICDEAHRTTGVTLSDEDESAFVKVHHNQFLSAKKRLYMTATPRLYRDSAKKIAADNDMVLCSMDDPKLYGEQFYHIGFGEAVNLGLLSDYKVLVLTVSDQDLPPAAQQMIANGTTEIRAAHVNKLIGCVNALSKQIIGDRGVTVSADPPPMSAAVAFCQNIAVAKKTTAAFNQMGDLYYKTLSPSAQNNLVVITADHVDGTMSAPAREQKLGWLKAADRDTRRCHVLTNVRCLSEGVDVPTLDAVMFLSARNSQVDVVQSVGRVMRRAPGKKYGYIIIPIVTPSGVEGAAALDNNPDYAVVWTVLNALRAHDDRFAATVNKIELNKNKPDTIVIGGPSHGENLTVSGTELVGKTPADHALIQMGLQFDKMQTLLYAKLVEKVGDRRYWEQWARDVADIATRQIERIRALVTGSGEHRAEFAKFLDGLRRNINPSIADGDAIEMLAQHLITQPVFEALFENYSFVKNNAVSQSMEKMLALLVREQNTADRGVLQKFYDSVRQRAAGIDNTEARQRIIIELYDKFFRTAFPLMVERLGIVYTPVEVVDYIIRSVAAVLQKEFNRTLGDENVHILDPFTGTGTFITRLLQSGLINSADLSRKYAREIHANEIVLLAYYIASVNIENVYHDLQGSGSVSLSTGAERSGYAPFNGICLTDTFQLGETGGTFEDRIFPVNSARVSAQKKAPLRVIIGNPPYSIGQKSANDNAQNLKYPKLEKRVAETYTADSDASSVKSLYDSYIKAFRWSSDRLDPKHGGIIAFITNNGWLESNGAGGFRHCLGKEFSSIYIFNLRGAIRGKSGITAKKEGQNVFDIMTGVAITILVKKPADNGKATIHYHDIGDYLTRSEKFEKIKKLHSIADCDMNWQILTPNEHNDWLNQRNDIFNDFIPLAPETKFEVKTKSIFTVYSLGLNTNRDAWVYNYSKEKLNDTVSDMVKFYNRQVKAYAAAHTTNPKLKIEDFIDMDAAKISWSSSLIPKVERNVLANFEPQKIRQSLYRPFNSQNLYFGEHFIHRRGQFDQLFPTPTMKNLVICVSGLQERRGFASLITDKIPDLNNFDGGTQCFPLYWYEDTRDKATETLFDRVSEPQGSYYARRDGISDHILGVARKLAGDKVTKPDIFHYVYAVLHHPDYRQTFAADLKKTLPRLPLPENSADFWQFVKAGKTLADLHLNYEQHADGAKKLGVNVAQAILPVSAKTQTSLSVLPCDYPVTKMRFPKTGKIVDKTQIIYNDTITISGIPAIVYDYTVNGKSAIEWVMERYQVTTHKDSGITNDPNDWPREQNHPRYILDLLLSIISLSVCTVELVRQLPPLPLTVNH
ncbi:MAG: DEAD/DEAH box helicase family protein [Verrucomicrobiales bacterium]|jgi:predicted helicase|nr:DEAD/DEAH box helicase family protein [Verrucomicrobiales bacterium]